MTAFINSRCTEINQIDTNALHYKNFVNFLNYATYFNLINEPAINNYKKEYSDILFGQKRISAEKVKSGGNIYDKMTPMGEKDDIIDYNAEISIKMPEKIEYYSRNDMFGLIMLFYGNNGVNLAVALGDIFEFLKAQTLLTGTLKEVKYDLIRQEIILDYFTANITKLYTSSVEDLLKGFNAWRKGASTLTGEVESNCIKIKNDISKNIKGGKYNTDIVLDAKIFKFVDENKNIEHFVKNFAIDNINPIQFQELELTSINSGLKRSSGGNPRKFTLVKK
jgi:hypothetical protein